MSSATPKENLKTLAENDVPIDISFAEQLYHTIHLLYPKEQAAGENAVPKKNDSPPGRTVSETRVDDSTALSKNSSVEYV